jgi:hemerythrin-like metal-binding protein
MSTATTEAPAVANAHSAPGPQNATAPSWQGPCAPGLAWSEALTVSLQHMDDTHEAFVALLAAVQTAPDTELLARWRALVAHTQDHFDREDAWMVATGFAPGSCHMTQHKVVLQVLKEGLLSGDMGVLTPIRQMAHELTIWFPQHAQTMDAGLALHLKSVDFDTATGRVRAPDALPAEPISGCGGTCSTSAEQAN